MHKLHYVKNFSPLTTHNSLKKAAFTLAEVLIALTVIGVVAALTLPPLIQNYKEQVTVKKLKKAYSTVQQALNLAISENGTVNNWSTYTSNGLGGTTADVANIFSKYLKITETLNDNISSQYVNLNNEQITVRYSDRPLAYVGKRYILNDGTMFAIVTFAGSNSARYWCINPPTNKVYFCGFINVDLNGHKKGPNKLGEDTFGFILYSNKIVPIGGPDYPSTTYWHSFNDCLSGTKGLECTAWVLANENMDYLHCPEKLSWTGKHSCKD